MYTRLTARLVLTFLASFLVVSAASAQSGFVFHSNGTAGSFNYCTSNSCVSLFAGRGGSGSTTQTMLSFGIFQATEAADIQITGFGVIPNNDLQGDSTSTLSLSTDLSNNAQFMIQTCTFDFSTGDFTCGSTPGGPVNITWKKDRTLFALHSVNSQSQTFANFMIRFNGTTDMAFGPATGSILGLPVTTPQGQLGVAHDTTIEVIHNP
jgi:hypothetical protein